MAFERAVNPETGEVVFLVNNQWVKPTDTAVNDKGEKAYLVGNQWEVPTTPVAPTPPPAPKDASPLLGSAEKGIVGAKQAIKQAQLASLMDLQAANKEKYGETYQAAPKEELDAITALDKSIVDKLQSVAQYGVERKEIEAKRGVNPLMQDIRAIGSSDAYKNADTIDQLKMYGDAVWNKKSDIPGYIASIGLESLPASIPSIAAAMAVKFGGMGPKAAAIAGGGGSALTEFGSQYAELRAEGLDHKEAWEKAGVKSGVIGMFDAASFNSAGSAASKILKNVEKGALKATAKETGKEISTQALYGMAGEAGGSLAIGQKLDPIQIIEEGLGEVVGAPLEAASTYRQNVAKAKEPKFTTDEKGNLVKTEESAPLAPSTPGAPIPAGAQQDLFTTEQAPYQVTPNERVAQTETGETVVEPIPDAQVKAKQEASDKAQTQIADLTEQLKNAATRDEALAIRDQISKLELQVEQTPGVKIDTLGQEYTTLEAKKAELKATQDQLIQQRDAAPTLDAKQALSEQINALENQGVQINERQQQLLAEGKTTAKELPAAEETVAEPELNVANVITEDDFKTMGIGKTNKKLREAILGKSLANPEEKQAVLDALTKYSQGKISSNMATRVGDFIDSISQETTNVPRGDVSGAVPGGSEPSVRVPSVPSAAASATQAPIPGGVAGNIGTAGGLDAGEGGVREDGAAPLAPKGTAESNAQLYKAAGGKPKLKGIPKFIAGAVERFRKFEEAYKKNQLLSTQIFGKLQNWGSFDDALNNATRAGMMDLVRKGELNLEQAKFAMMRSSMFQTLFRSKLASDGIMQGDVKYDPIANEWTVVKDSINMEALHNEIRNFAERTGVTLEVALDQFHKAYEANRVHGFYDDLAKTRGEITRTTKAITALTNTPLKKRTGDEQKQIAKKKALLSELNKKASRIEGLVRHMNYKEMQSGMQLYNSNPEMKAGTDIWNVMRERVIKHLVDSGINTEEEAKDLMDAVDYVPFQREMDVEEAKGFVVRRKGVNERMTQPGIKGSMRDVKNIVENMENWMRWSLSRAISNQQLKVSMDAYKTADPHGVREGEGNKTNTFSIYEDGVKKLYHVANPAIVQAFTGVDSIIFPSMGYSSKFRTAFTHAYTRIPLVPVAQLILKDTWEAMVTSGLKHPYMLVAQIPKEIVLTALGKSEARQKLTERALLSTHEYRGLSDADEVMKRLNLEDPSNYQKAMSMLDKWSALNDNMLRQAVFAQAKLEGKSDKEASMMATEIFNFRRMSGNPVLQWANNHIPFLNAFGQMQRVTIKVLSGSGITPKTRAEGIWTLATTTGILAGLSFMYAAGVSDDEDYQNMNRMQRDSSFVIPGTGGLRIPMRWGLPLIPKILGEYLYHDVAKTVYVDPKMFKSAMYRAVLKQVEPPIGGLVLPAVGLATNHDFVQNREIVNATQRKLEPAQQSNKNTTEISKLIGERANISPLQLDYFFKSYLGAYSTLMALANNSIAESRGKARPTPENPTKNFAMSLPGVGSFISKDDASGALSDFYEAANEVDVIVNTYKKLAQSDVNKATEYADKNQDKLMRLQRVEQNLGRLNTYENYVINLPSTSTNPNQRTMSANEKAVEIKRIEEARKSLREPVHQLRKQLYK